MSIVPADPPDDNLEDPDRGAGLDLTRTPVAGERSTWVFSNSFRLGQNSACNPALAE